MKIQLNHIRKRLLVYLAHEVALPYFKLVRKGYHFPYSLKQLQHLPDGTVGRALYRFFNDNDIHLLPHYEKHDIKHVVLGYPPTEEGEVSLQCFMLANGRITAPVLFSVAVGLLIMPDKWRSFRQAWNRGRQTPSLNRLNWFDLVPQQLQEVRHELFSAKAQDL
ncbi:Coq4 family protein [Taibaiella koreensis]|uniref:Coq4 family protein n=1 Tax=Taibaiella koreensis TaxID=1268548 RepID=UPI0013C33168|nr:Coq4 family protein [Taibaiella koreensis]